jgi:hypothetical protein
MRDIFACLQCHSIYAINRHQQQPLARPRCKVCFANFPPKEMGDWLAYERAEPEWTVREWLSGQDRRFNLPSPDQKLAAMAQRRIEIADSAPPSSRLQKVQSPFLRGRTLEP